MPDDKWQIPTAADGWSSSEPLSFDQANTANSLLQSETSSQSWRLEGALLVPAGAPVTVAIDDTLFRWPNYDAT